jgi:hypothetical protein|tara:strand:- start:131 stop:433 length:303 start_codon:yes stop_codon:yes gene_type:complete
MPARLKKQTQHADGSSTITEMVLDWEEIRINRDWALQTCDKFALGDMWDDLTTEQKAEFKAFRKTLRDIPQTYSNAADVVFPEKPSWLGIEVNDAIFTGI